MFKKIFGSLKKIAAKTVSVVMAKKTYFIIGVIVVAVGGYFLYRHYHTNSAAPKYVTAQVQKGTITSSVSGSGNVIVDQTANVAPQVAGTVSSLRVKVGDNVTKGQTLFYIDSPQTDIDLDKDNASYSQAVQALENAQTQDLQNQLNLTMVASKPDVTKAAAALSSAEQSVESAYASMLQADDNYDTKVTNSQANPPTATTEDVAVADQQAEVAASALKVARVNYTNAQQAYNQALANAGINQQIAQQQVTAGQDGVQVAQLNVDAALATYNNEKDLAAKRTVTAPIAGTISVVNISSGDQVSASSGSSASAGSSSSSSSSSSTTSSSASSSSSAPIVIDDLSSLKASVAINEVDIPKVAVNQKATLTFDAVTDLTLTGKVEKIDSTGTNTQNVVTYNVTIGFDSLDPRIKPEMSVSAAITTNVKQDILIVPSAAVKTDSSGNKTVQIMKNGTPQTQDVQTGISDDTNTEITSGLNEGDTIVTQTITTSATASTSSTSARGSTGGGAAGARGLGL